MQLLDKFDKKRQREFLEMRRGQIWKHEIDAFSDALKEYLLRTKIYGEILLDFTTWFKVVRKVLLSYFGRVIMLKKHDKFKSMYNECNEELLNELIVEANNKIATGLNLIRSDQVKWGSVLKNLTSQIYINSDQLPMSIFDKISALINHPVDSNYKNSTESKNKC